MTLEELAKMLAGNHRKFECFAWTGAPEDSDNWCIFYTHGRDSDPETLQKAKTVDRIMSKFGKDLVQAQHHSHWGFGWIDGYAVRVYDGKGRITKAFKALHKLRKEDS